MASMESPVPSTTRIESPQFEQKFELADIATPHFSQKFNPVARFPNWLL
jgi:hypothetical protein